MKKIIQYIGFGIVTILVAVGGGILVLAEKDKKLETLLPIYANKESKFLPVLGMQVHYRVSCLRYASNRVDSRHIGIPAYLG